MASDESSGTRPPPVVLRIKLRYDDVDAMVQRFAPNIGKSGLFLPTKSMQAVGAEVKFELRLTDDTPVLVGLGRVKAARAHDPANPRAAFGIALELMRVTPASRDVILKMLTRRRELGLPEIRIPLPEDIDAARRGDGDTAVRTSPGGSGVTPVPGRDSSPVLGGSSPGESVPVLTAPRRTTGPIAVAKTITVAPLAPELPRRRRPPVHEVIERASGPSAASALTVPGLDDDGVDVGAVLARARALAGGDLDAELDALRDSAAAPIEIGIEAASAELARQLGGAAVSRDRSARWAPPPSTIGPSLASAVVEPALADPVPALAEPMPALAEPVPALAPEAPAPAPSFSGAVTHVDVEEEVAPEQIADEIHRLSESDFEEVEHTQIGAMPVDGEELSSAASEEIARSLEAQLAAAEDEPDDFGFRSEVPAILDASAEVPAGGDFVMPLGGSSEAAAYPDDDGAGALEEIAEIDEFEILAEADAEDADLLSADGEAESHDHAAAYQDAYPAPPPDLDRPPAEEFEREPVAFAAPAYEGPAYAEPAYAEPAYAEPAYAEPAHLAPGAGRAPHRGFSEADFAARLDLSDEFEAAPEAPDRERSYSEVDSHLGELDPRIVSAGHALAAFDDDLDADSQFTVAGDLPRSPADFDPPYADAAASEVPPGSAFDQSDVLPSERRVPVGPAPAGDGYDLETALEALDVDLDDLAMPHAKTEFAGSTLPPRHRSPEVVVRAPTQGRRPGLPRATTEDGILIDFDDPDDD